MGYCIVYGDQPIRWEKEHLRPGRIVGYGLVCFALFALLTARLWPAGKAVLSDALLPGDAEATWEALENMTNQLKAGEAIGDAVVVFCREIVDGALLSD